MTPNGDDRDLRPLFEAQREADRRAMPPFASLAGGGTNADASRTAWTPVRWALAGAAAVALAALLLRPAPVPPEPTLDEALEMARAISSWSAPTDALPDLSGAGIREGVPTMRIDAFLLPELPATDAGSN